jgi:PAS domain S-box-containing protein
LWDIDRLAVKLKCNFKLYRGKGKFKKVDKRVYFGRSNRLNYQPGLIQFGEKQRDIDQMDHQQANLDEKEWRYRSIFDAANDGLIVTDLETGLVVEANPAACKLHGCSLVEFIGRQLTDFIDPESRHVFDEYIRAFQAGGTFDAKILHRRQDGSTFYAEWHGTVFNYQGRTSFLGVIRDISQRIHAEKLLQQRVDKHTYEQVKLLEISHILASTLKFQPGMILDQLREIIEYSHGGLFALEDSTLVALAMRGARHLDQTAPIRIHVKGPETLAALFNGHMPIRIADVWADSAQAQFLRSLLDDGAAVLLAGMNAWMWVPLAVSGRIIGGIGVAHEKKGFFTPHHADLALSAANQAAITMINAELYGQAQALAVLEERQRLARNLHDAINQSLFSAGLIAEVLPRLWERDQEEARRSIEDLLHLTRGVQAEMRALVAELRPSTLTDANLGDLIHLLGNALSGRVNILVTITAAEGISLPAEVQVTFYRVCQEALNNVARHAKASHVDIKLQKEGSEITLIVRDDGQGFDAQHTLTGHYGLSMMRERAEAIGAVISVTSQPGHGTELIMRWSPRPPKESL